MREITIKNFPQDCRIVIKPGYGNVLAVAFSERRIIAVRKDSFDFSPPSPPIDPDSRPDLIAESLKKFAASQMKKRYSYAVIGRGPHPHYIGINHIDEETDMNAIFAKAMTLPTPSLCMRWFNQIFRRVKCDKKLLAKDQKPPYSNVLVLFVPHGIRIVTSGIQTYYYENRPGKHSRATFV